MNFAEHWHLDPRIDFLNHGSFGATPKIVLEAQRELTESLEREPIRFLAPERDLLPRLEDVRQRLGDLVGASAESIGFVRNATDGVNAVVRSFPFGRGDEVLVTDHGYNACNNAIRFAADRFEAKTLKIKIPFPLEHESQVVEAITNQFSDRTKLLLVDHVTSPTGLVFPIKEIIDSAHDRGIRVLVDGAHAPGMLPLNLANLNADYYTANHHKWLCGPKASGFLYVNSQWQNEVRPTVISHGANREPLTRSRFLEEFDWVGTYDPTPILSLPAAIEFLDGLFEGGLEQLMTRNRELALTSQRILADALNVPIPAPASMIGSLVSIPLPESKHNVSATPDGFQQFLYKTIRSKFPYLSDRIGTHGFSAFPFKRTTTSSRLSDSPLSCETHSRSRQTFFRSRVTSGDHPS